MTRFILSWILPALLLLAPSLSPAVQLKSRVPDRSLSTQDGTLMVAIGDDFSHGRSERHFLLHAKGGPDLRVLVPAKLAGSLRSGQQLRVTARRAGAVLDATVSGGSVQVLNQPRVAAAQLRPGAEIRKVLVLLVDIQAADGLHTVPTSCTTSNLTNNTVFGGPTTIKSVDGCYADTSFNTLGFGGAEYPGSARDIFRVTINEAVALNAACNYTPWANAADTAATSGGANLANYQHVVYILPQGTSCTWAGLGYVGCGNDCRAWIATYPSQICGYNDAIAHELGHNIGMWHASTDLNNDGTIDCEYCDYSDIMGYSVATMRTSNGAHKAVMQWVSPLNVTDGSAGGTWRITSLEVTDPNLRQIIQVNGTSGRPYFLSYRTATGIDATLPSGSTYLNKTNIHRHFADENTLFIGALADGESLVDATNGLTFTQLSHDAVSALVKVAKSTPATCSVNAPTVVVSPTSQYFHSLPSSRAYTVSVGNNDGADCSSTTFTLASTVPAGWTGGFNVPSLTLAPGVWSSATFTLSAPGAAAPKASFPFTVGTAVVGSHTAVTVPGTAQTNVLVAP